MLDKENSAVFYIGMVILPQLLALGCERNSMGWVMMLSGSFQRNTSLYSCENPSMI